ncbi:MAG: HutD family protein [Xanthomonadales bacterium]|nr:HutD family protein [Xanthomonadales bacterium]
MRLIHAIHAPTMPWKNGGGSTTELACWPPGAGLAEFDWRISIARIEANGPFSAFDGIDRVLVLLDGPGMTLRWPDRTVTVDATQPRIDFAGSPAPDCRLLDGLTRDFNLMWRASLGAAEVSIQSLAGDWQAQAPVDRQLAAYLRDGWAQSPAGPLQAGDLLVGSTLSLHGEGTLWVMSLPQRRESSSQ